MFELTYKCDNYSANFGATDTAIESLKLMINHIETGGFGGQLREITIKYVDTPTPAQDQWGWDIKDRGTKR